MSILTKVFKQKNRPSKSTDTIFSEASSFADDMYATQIARTTLYQLLMLMFCCLSALLGIVMLCLLPLKETQLVVVHKSNDGVVWVEPPATAASKVTPAQTESEIVNYITHRESYSAFSYEQQYKLVSLMSDQDVAKEYIKEQSVSNPASPIVQLGDEGVRFVTVESVVFLDSENQDKDKRNKDDIDHKNLAQVNFRVETKQAAQQDIIPYVATLSWEYRGVPSDPESKWQNWDGFTITHYTVTRKNAANR